MNSAQALAQLTRADADLRQAVVDLMISPADAKQYHAQINHQIISLTLRRRYR
tara:strand:- start:47 stop:205 length:159 start_codon:yes stop_codon:yes gene_type:complete